MMEQRAVRLLQDELREVGHQWNNELQEAHAVMIDTNDEHLNANAN